MNLLTALIWLMPFGITNEINSSANLVNVVSAKTTEWTITQHTSKEGLDQIIEEVSAGGGELIVHKAKYEDGLLTGIKITLSSAIGKVEYFNDEIKADTQICLKLEKSQVSAGCCTEK